MATAVGKLAAQAGPNFRIGGKQVFLPNHVITFIQPKPNQPPNLATFIVPLRFNKLDLRDYLYHAYNVEVLAVRSFINTQKLETWKRDADGKVTASPTHRRQPQKKMTVELVKPFVFPETPEDLSPWDNELHKAFYGKAAAREKEYTKILRSRQHKHESDRPVTKQRIALAQQAQRLREGKEKWINDTELDEKWIEVEKDEEMGRK